MTISAEQPGFEIRDPRFHDVIAPEARLEVLAGGFTFTEGPIWHREEQWCVFSDIATSRQYRWSEAEGLSLFRTPSNQANGNCFDREGRIVSCEHASSQVTRIDHDGKLVRVLASHFEGKELNSPNDIVCDSQSRLWFTDPSFGRIREDLGILRDQELPHQGVYRLDPDGSLHMVADDFRQPNGLCLSNDERQLFINDSAAPAIRIFDVTRDGSLVGGEVWADVTGQGSFVEGSGKWVPDGMKIDTHNRIFCNGPGGVHIFSEDATCLGVIYLPEKSTNFCFAGPKLEDLLITASTRLYRIKTQTTAL
ncbi:SMP-30/gluconolactonase/LRE family protein [Pseudahrensia aquimaris]|uniref:SMP-30/gluconolactonase/LRE family protein n=1 Tax=Pseudahrensia aquimaris TaxID=744461 RepID=A0ABW3FAW1_9HYPH